MFNRNLIVMFFIVLFQSLFLRSRAICIKSNRLAPTFFHQGNSPRIDCRVFTDISSRSLLCRNSIRVNSPGKFTYNCIIFKFSNFVDLPFLTMPGIDPRTLRKQRTYTINKTIRVYLKVHAV